MNNINVQQKQISQQESAEINQQVKTELVEHLYRGCLPGTVGGIPVGIAFIANFYGYTPTNLLIAWAAYYFLALANLGLVYFAYQKYKAKYPLNNWLLTYSIAMSICAIAWGLSSYLIPTDSMFREYVAIIALLIFANGYAAGTIGVFELCVVTLTIIMMPLVAWGLFQSGSLYKLISVFTLIYYFFLLSINRRSTQWFKDSLKLKLENTLVSYQANHDFLTGLPNQRLLPQYIDAMIDAIKNTPDTFALISFSLNRMEMINDSLGHQAGDIIIKTVAMRLQKLAEEKSKFNQLRYIVTLSRKDNFNIILAPYHPGEGDEKIKVLFSALDEPIYLENQGVKVTASIGVSIYNKDGREVNSLLICADAAMLNAKQFGGNKLAFYRPEITEHLPKQLALETDLHDALKHQQLELYYQPLVETKSNMICGMEALIRWPHPEHGFISPMRFIPLAEQTGLIIPIGEWIFYEACKQARMLHDKGFSHVKVAVNLSEKQLRQENLIAIIKRVLDHTKLDPRYLELEITETAILDETVTSVIKELTGLGLSLAVDDFGTGYSGLSYLKRFTVDKLKIDQSFIRDIPANNDSITIVSAIIAMAKALEIHTLAEGVETEAQLKFLQNKGCDFIQGYYFSKPLPIQSLIQFLTNYHPNTHRSATEAKTIL